MHGSCIHEFFTYCYDHSFIDGNNRRSRIVSLGMLQSKVTTTNTSEKSESVIKMLGSNSVVQTGDKLKCSFIGGSSYCQTN